MECLARFVCRASGLGALPKFYPKGLGLSVEKKRTKGTRVRFPYKAAREAHESMLNKRAASRSRLNVDGVEFNHTRQQRGPKLKKLSPFDKWAPPTLPPTKCSCPSSDIVNARLPNDASRRKVQPLSLVILSLTFLYRGSVLHLNFVKRSKVPRAREGQPCRQRSGGSSS